MLYFGVIKIGGITLKSYVYFIQSTNKLVKIGVTNNLSARLKQLQTGSPGKLKLLGSIKTNDPYKLEKRLHNKYKNMRVNGEWFNVNEMQVEDELALHNKPSLEDFGYENNKTYFHLGKPVSYNEIYGVYLETGKNGKYRSVHTVVNEIGVKGYYIVYTYNKHKGLSEFYVSIIDSIPNEWMPLWNLNESSELNA